MPLSFDYNTMNPIVVKIIQIKNKCFSSESYIGTLLLVHSIQEFPKCFLFDTLYLRQSNLFDRLKLFLHPYLQEKSRTTSVSQENRVTITLIAVVVCFIIFQLPWAAYLIVKIQNPDLDFNLQRVLGNVFNFLAALNAAANFFLYCVLSDKYRKTVRELITGHKGRRERGTTTTTSLMFNNTSRCSYKPAPTAPPGIK